MMDNIKWVDVFMIGIILATILFALTVIDYTGSESTTEPATTTTTTLLYRVDYGVEEGFNDIRFIIRCEDYRADTVKLTIIQENGERLTRTFGDVCFKERFT